MKKIFVRMTGGLGNQLFIYAFAKFIQNQLKDSNIIIDTGEYKKYKVRKFNLDKYYLDNKSVYMTSNDMTFFERHKYNSSRFLYRCVNYMWKRLFSKTIDNVFVGRFDRGFLYNENTYHEYKLDRTKRIYIYGYFQNVQYCNEIKKNIMKDLIIIEDYSVRYKKYLDFINDNIVIGVSMRVGDDYASLGWPICSNEYYNKAIDRIKEEFPMAKVMVFSDDIVKVKKGYEIKYEPIYVEGCNSVETLELLRKCHHVVISNSTFSWWGAFLSEHDGRKIAPEIWFAKKRTIDTGLFFSGMELLDDE